MLISIIIYIEYIYIACHILQPLLITEYDKQYAPQKWCKIKSQLLARLTRLCVLNF